MDYSSTKTTEKESKIELLQSDNRGSLCSGSVVSSSAYIRSELPTVCGQSNCRGEVHEERQQSHLPKVSSVVVAVVVDKGNTYLENKTCSKTCKESRKCALFGNIVVAISGKFSRKVCFGLDIELRARKVLHKVLKVKPVE